MQRKAFGRHVGALALMTAIGIGMAASLTVGDALAAMPVKAPSVTAVTPREGPTSGGSEVTISGKNIPTCSFTLTGPICPGIIVYFGTEPGLVFQSAKKEGLQVFAPSQPATGTVGVTVVTVGGTSATSTAASFMYSGTPAEVVPGEIPVVTALAANHGTSKGFTEVKIKGEHLTPRNEVCVECNGDVVQFGTKKVSVSQGSATELTVITPPNAVGTVDVTVSTNPGGTSATSENDRYTYE